MGTLVLNELSSTSLFERNSGNEHVTRERREDTNFHQVCLRLPAVSPSRQQQEIDQVKALADLSIQIGSIFAQQMFLHPCFVLRRQCQIHHTGAWYHLTPLSLIQTVINITKTQGSTVMWKGLGSVYIVRGVNMMSETVVSEFTTFPRDISCQIPLKQLGEHVLLKSLVFAISTPFLVASLVETVQSNIASERSGVFDTLFEGALRMTAWSVPKTARQIPLLRLIMPTVIFRMSHYIVDSIAQQSMISSMLLEKQEVRGQRGEEGREHSMYETYYLELLASFTGGILADMITFPFETVLNRLYVQGTRTIIDNTDTGIGVIPVNTHYEGVIDCFKSIIVEEGILGLYRGFGALILQYTVHAIILKLVKFMCEYLSKEFSFQSSYRDPHSLHDAQFKAQDPSNGEGFVLDI